MAWIIRMPKLGQTMEAGLVQQWLKQEGDRVEQGEAIAVIESEKFTEELEAREAGVLRKILIAEGEEAPPGAPIGIVAAPDEALPEIEAVAPPALSATVATQAAPARSVAAAAAKKKIKASPAAKKLAQDRGVDLAQIEGTGPESSITKEDVEKFASQPQPAAAESQPFRTPLETRAFGPMRRTIATRLGQSYRDAVHVTLNKKIGLANLLEAHQQLKAKTAADISIIDFIIAAVVKTLEQHPEFNAVFENDRLDIIKEKNIGLAVDIERGLLTVVLHKADEKDVVEISSARRKLTRKAIRGKYTPDDLAGGTFTISNLGPLGIDSFDPIINPPEIAILGLGRLQEEAVRDEHGGVAFKPLMTFSLSFDHRIVDGADAARFLLTLEEHITNFRG